VRKTRRLASILRPRPGRRLPPELGPRRVHEIAAELPGGVRGNDFADLLRRIDDEAPIYRGNRVEVYTRGEAAFTAMLEAIEAARWEVLLEFYIFKDDHLGQQVFEALRRAAGRGAAVRVLADAFGSLTTRDAFWRDLRTSGVEVHLYHPLLRQPWYHPYRDHRKILAVDRQIAFTGGMNIGEEYGSARSERGNVWRDTHCRVAGPVVPEMVWVFAEGWERAGGEAFLEGSAEPATSMEGELPGAEARVLVLESRPGRGNLEAASALAALVAAARESVWVTNAYFAPRIGAVEALGRAAGRGLDVRLLLPGISDAPIVRHAGHGWFSPLLERGVRVFEYKQRVLHAKSMVVDRHASVLGSTNLDFRSFHFNAECNLVIFDDATGATLAEAFREDLEHAREIAPAAWRARSPLHRLGDRLARWMSPVL
jgi:cardiolipin synthase